MKILVAFDKFKGSLSAADACQITSQTLLSLSPAADLEEAPLTDGGEGFVELLTRPAGGEIRRCHVTGPLGKPTEASFGLVSIENLPPATRDILRLPTQGTLAVVEMAQASGLQLLPANERDPWKTTTRGTGELLQKAAAANPMAIVVGLGGSATHDLGLGALQALGLKAEFDSTPNNTGPHQPDLSPAIWTKVQRFVDGFECRLPPLWIASDVDNPLLGPRGAATVFAPQKGLRPADLEALEKETARMANLLCEHFHQDPNTLSAPGSGAAGGIGTGLRLACGARITSGFSLVRAWFDLDRKLSQADFILTGEGCFDESSLEGKGPGVVVKRAQAERKNCLVLAGRIDLPKEVQKEFSCCRFLEISPRELPTEQAMAAGKQLLENCIRENASLFLK